MSFITVGEFSFPFDRNDPVHSGLEKNNVPYANIFTVSRCGASRVTVREISGRMVFLEAPFDHSTWREMRDMFVNLDGKLVSVMAIGEILPSDLPVNRSKIIAQGKGCFEYFSTEPYEVLRLVKTRSRKIWTALSKSFVRSQRQVGARFMGDNNFSPPSREEELAARRRLRAADASPA